MPSHSEIPIHIPGNDRGNRSAAPEIYYDQPNRKFGITKNNWYTLYDMGMLGIINHSRVPLRMAIFAGFAGAVTSILIAFVYLLLKLIRWDTSSFGLAPMLIGVFFIASIHLVFLGILANTLELFTRKCRSGRT